MKSDFFSPFRTPLLVTILLLQAALLLRLGWLTSPNRTELGHFVAARNLWKNQKFDLFHVNPPLVRVLAAWATCHLTTLQDDWNDYSSNPRDRSEWAVSIAFARANDWQDVRYAFFLARAACIPIILFGGFVGYLWGRELFGEAAGFAFLTLWTVSPQILGWGATICPDVCAASLGIAALYSYRKWLLCGGWVWCLAAGFALGLLLLTKMTWIVAIALWPLLGMIVLRNQAVRMPGILAVPAVALLVLNAGYLFDGSFQPLKEYQFISRSLGDAETGNRFTDSPFGWLPVPFPKEFVLGFDTQKLDFERGFTSYLCGTFSERGWWYYYFVAFFVKAPLGTIFLTLLAIVVFPFQSFRSHWQEEMILLAPLFILLFVVSVQTGFSLHARYIIPACPFLFLGIIRVFRSSVRPIQTLAWLLLLGTVASSLSVYPYSMSYFNEGIGGPQNGPKYLLGSNVDWGQDLYELKQWYDSHPEARPLRTAYSGTYPLESLGIAKGQEPPIWTPRQAQTENLAYLHSFGPQPGWFLFAINDLYDPTEKYNWIKSATPTARIGYSFRIYHLTKEEANQLRISLNLPEL